MKAYRIKEYLSNNVRYALSKKSVEEQIEEYIDTLADTDFEKDRIRQEIDLYVHIEEYEVSIFGTYAPESYDGFGTFTVERRKDFKGKEYRVVAIEKEHEMWQTGRYFSGLHGAFPVDEEEKNG